MFQKASTSMWSVGFQISSIGNCYSGKCPMRMSERRKWIALRGLVTLGWVGLLHRWKVSCSIPVRWRALAFLVYIPCLVFIISPTFLVLVFYYTLPCISKRFILVAFPGADFWWDPWLDRVWKFPFMYWHEWSSSNHEQLMIKSDHSSGHAFMAWHTWHVPHVLNEDKLIVGFLQMKLRKRITYSWSIPQTIPLGEICLNIISTSWVMEV